MGWSRRNDQERIRKGRRRQRMNIVHYNERRRVTRECRVALERVTIPQEVHVANEQSQPLFEEAVQVSGPIARSGLVRQAVDEGMPVHHRLWYQCQFQVRFEVCV